MLDPHLLREVLALLRAYPELVEARVLGTGPKAGAVVGGKAPGGAGKKKLTAAEVKVRVYGYTSMGRERMTYRTALTTHRIQYPMSHHTPTKTKQERGLAIDTLEAVASLTLFHLKETWVKDPLLLVDGAKAAGEQGGLKPVQVGGALMGGNIDVCN